MLRTYITRHGQDEDNAKGLLNGRRDCPLTAIGRLQAQQLAVGIRALGIMFHTVYSSPLRRAYQTAETVTAALDLPAPQVLPDLIERDFGFMTGKHVGDIEAICGSDILKTEAITYFLSALGAESFPALLVRTAGVLKAIHEKHDDGSVLLVTHGDIGKMLYTSFYDLDWRDGLQAVTFGNSELLVLSRGCELEYRHVLRIEQHNT